jgi:hypothetical protein
MSAEIAEKSPADRLFEMSEEDARDPSELYRQLLRYSSRRSPA